jgi:FMN-dependent oxidoreductase (nitrilotriacetate monooxygenase family)
MPRPIVLNAFDMNCVTHIVSGTWRHPASQAARYKDLGYWTNLSRVLERGLFDGLFIADVLGIYDVYGGSQDTAIRTGAQVPVNDPLLVVPAMAAVTEHLGFGVTVATSFEQPYPFARRMSTLDHLTGGRIGWNIVTGYLESAARNHGQTTITPHAERYDIADEFLEVAYKLWEGSWEDGAVGTDPTRADYADPAKVHPIGHSGRYFTVPGTHLCEPSPQRTPVLYQAGASSRGRAFGAAHAEVVFLTEPTIEGLRTTVADIRARAVASGRDPYDVKVVNGLSVVAAPTDAAAEARLDEYRRYLDPAATLALWSGWLGSDLSRFGLDDPVALSDNEYLKSSVQAFGQGQWTLRDFVDRKGVGVETPVIAGSGPTVADELERWVTETDVDGFNITNLITPGTFEQVADHVVPELQRRGLYKAAYAPGSLREKLFGRGPRLPESHPGARYRRPANRPGGAP